MWQKIRAYLDTNLLLDILSLCWIFIILYLIDNHHYFIAGIIFYIPIIIYIVTHYKRLLSRIKKWWEILFGFGVLFFFSYIYAKKSLSYTYDIDPEYLNYSVSIYATLIALLLGTILIFLFYFVSYVIKFCYWKFLSFFSSKYQRNIQSLEFCFAPFVMIGLFIPISPLFYAGNLLTDYYIITDAYPVSDCGEKYNDIVYIRKSNTECYSIKLTIPPVFNIIKAAK